MSIILLNGSHPDYLINLRGPLIKDLVRRGHDVHVTSPNTSRSQEGQIENLGAAPHNIKLQRRSMNPLADIVYFLEIKALIKRIKPDFVIGYTIKPNIWGSLAAAANGVESASMITGLGFAFNDKGGPFHSIGQYFVHLLFRFATRCNRVVIFQNPDDLNDFAKSGCLTDLGKAKLVNGSGVDTKFYAPAPLPEAPVFLLIARLLVSKGVREYAEAAITVLSKRSNCRFLIAGFLEEGADSITKEELDKWIDSGIGYLGSLDDVRPAIESCGIYVLPSYREGTPRTVLEASSMGRASIVTDVPGCREVVVDGKTGFVVPVRDPDTLADAMLKLADSPALREEMGNEACLFCQEKYDVDKVNRSLITHLGL